MTQRTISPFVKYRITWPHVEATVSKNRELPYVEILRIDGDWF